MFAINGTKRQALAGFSSPLGTAGGWKGLLASSLPLFSAERRNSRSLLNAPSAPRLGDGGGADGVLLLGKGCSCKQSLLALQHACKESRDSADKPKVRECGK